MKILEQLNIDSEELEARVAFIPGFKLYGHCGGIFGRDRSSNMESIIIDIEEDFITIKDKDNRTNCGTVKSWLELLNNSNRACRELRFENKEY